MLLSVCVRVCECNNRNYHDLIHDQSTIGYNYTHSHNSVCQNWTAFFHLKAIKKLQCKKMYTHQLIDFWHDSLFGYVRFFFAFLNERKKNGRPSILLILWCIFHFDKLLGVCDFSSLLYFMIRFPRCHAIQMKL